MITKRAIELSRIAREISKIDAVGGMSATHKLLDELCDNCSPTRAEFDIIMSEVILSADSLWRIIEFVPKWINAQTNPKDAVK